MLTDSHCHLQMLDLTPYAGSLQQVLMQAQEEGVGYFLSVAVSLEDHPKLVSIAEQFDNVFISVGLHPNEAPEQPLDVDLLREGATHPKVVAIGETGLDYYRTSPDMLWQKKRFAQHIECAREFHKPLIIHTRNAKDDTLDIMKTEKADEVGGVMHCFTEDWETAKQALDLNFYISFSGIVTFKNATTLQEVAKKVPLDRLLIETDCPYLAPVPHRGKPNVPAYVSHVAQFIATLRDEPFANIAQSTTENFFSLFRPET
jgi:TatD DNase family protein